MREKGERAVLVATAGGLYRLGPRPTTELAGREVTALAPDAEGWWALLEGREIWRERGGSWERIATLAAGDGTCLVAARGGLLVGTAGARLLRLRGRRAIRVAAFERTEGRARWYTPWGDPPDTRSVAVDACGTLFVNVHVGGVVRSPDGGRTWHPTLDIETDVHQVLAHPMRPGLVLVAAAVGLGVSRDGGASWTFRTEGTHGRYMRAVALAGDTVLVSASTGPGARRGAVYRRPLEGDGPLERCRTGLPEWFPGNIDTHCLAADGTDAAVGTADGRVFRSRDAGRRWALLVEGLPPVRAVALA